MPRDCDRALRAGMVKNDTALSAQMNTAEGVREGRPEVSRTFARSLFGWWAFYRAVWTTAPWCPPEVALA